MPVAPPAVAVTENAFLYPNGPAGDIGAYEKAPLDRIQFTLDYVGWLAPGDTVASATFGSTPGSNPQLAVSNYSILNGGAANSAIGFVVSGGLDAVRYDLTVTMRTGSGNVRSDHITIAVPTQSTWDGQPQPTVPIPPAPAGRGFPIASAYGYGTPQQPTPQLGPQLGFANVASVVWDEDELIIINPRPQFTVSDEAPTSANALDRWFNTADGNIYDWVTDGNTSFWICATGGEGRDPIYTISATAPASPQVLDQWWDTANSLLKEYINDGTASRWVVIDASGNGIQYSAGASPPGTPNPGDEWFDTGGEVLYKWIVEGLNGFWLSV